MLAKVKLKAFALLVSNCVGDIPYRPKYRDLTIQGEGRQLGV
jgi:hypothetical protein